MSEFIHDASWSRHHAVSEIVEIGPGKKRANGFGFVHRTLLRNGEVIFLDSHEADRLTDTVIAIIPAQPGYFTIDTGNCMDGDPYTIREVVLAWRLTVSGDVQPVTIRGVNNNELTSIAVEQPSGAIWCPMDDCIYPTFEEFREAELKREAQRDRERQASHRQATEQKEGE